MYKHRHYFTVQRMAV